MLKSLYSSHKGHVVARLALALVFLAGSSTAWAGSADAYAYAADMTLIWAIPFAGILLSIALFPLLLPHFWHAHFGKISAFWALCFLIPFTATYGFEKSLYEVTHVAFLEYVPFTILLLALFTVTGGIRVKGDIRGTPAVNTAILALGTGAASIMGTTGAAMLLIRPLLRANSDRRHNVHVMVFFIFLVANVGGSLTPLGDPPLFLGFLKGVDFFWPTLHMALPMLIVSALLLTLFYGLDRFFYKRESADSDLIFIRNEERLGVEGYRNLILLALVVMVVFISGVWRPGGAISINGVQVEWQNLLRDGALLAIAAISFWFTDRRYRQANGFSWFPILEVAKLFAGIFITIVPVIAILKAGEKGALGFIIDAVSKNGAPDNVMYFWLTGILSSFLDNAPTYLVFFNTAGGDADLLMTHFPQTLLAISAGAVFMGAMTYIGNAPNFMVRSIAEDWGVKMPSFFGYMLWSVTILLPIFALLTVLFFL